MKNNIIDFQEKINKRKQMVLKKENNRLILIWNQNRKNEYRIMITVSVKKSFIEKIEDKFFYQEGNISIKDCKEKYFDRMITFFGLSEISEKDWKIIKKELLNATAFFIEYLCVASKNSSKASYKTFEMSGVMKIGKMKSD